jgi:anaphase-promoting complex subunit 2
MDDDEAALAAAGAWEPDPVLADPARSSRTRRMSDVIAALIGIYGSKELFITEYRCAGSIAQMLCFTLLSCRGSN